MVDCRSVSLLIFQAHYQTLSWMEKRAVQLHLACCSACRRFAKQSAFLQQACEYLEHGELADVKLSERAKQRIKQTLAEQTSDKHSP